MQLSLVITVGAISPGPSLALVVRQALDGGLSAGVRASVGHGLGIGFYTLLCMLGLGKLLVQSPGVFVAIQYTGALFLIYLAWQQWQQTPAAGSQQVLNKHELDQRGLDQQQLGQPLNQPTRVVERPFFAGLILALLSPKVVTFFVAVFSQFMEADMGWGAKWLMAMTASLIDMLWYIFVSLCLVKTPLFAWMQDHSRQVNRLSAMVLALLGVRIFVGA